ncbi:hypothetical protein GON03_00520 [Nocardioides sp. MAH-18]|uniref:Uncharacterized protein n=1 Tax=Nocardioides agri TaxID=2682843 RepID=A0A6L6XM44_9ACTN|nr:MULTISPECIES: hypothetical protein [unclassified Nocardioides]MBA2956499.1 hypothetical protein [Nocardioides sp. CGMCC 1.13656]MVQ47646.1 hypothetical protein [Nocardioides sp. MAH-18]
MSNHEPERMPERDISDDDLPEDLQPTDDNPLAKDLTDEDDPKPADELDMQGGKPPEGSEEQSDAEQSDEDDSEG